MPSYELGAFEIKTFLLGKKKLQNVVVKTSSILNTTN